ncbi:MAG TPA: EAL domain-containing protein [Dongiaceae bacterium]|nr:EAL domain-containing protein [Dongiaceae bacterium]
MKQNILIVDDQRPNLVALEATLSELDVNIIPATSGPEALSILLKQNVALVLLDVQMPGMDGFEVAGLMRQRGKTRHTPIIFLTAINKEDSHVFKGYESGGVDFLFKPFNPFVLISKVRIFLELDLRRQQLEEALNKLKQLKTSNEILLRSVGEGIIGVAANGVISFVNPAAEMVLGCTASDIIGQPVYKSVIVSAQQVDHQGWTESKIYKFCSQGQAYHTDVAVFRTFANRMLPVEYTASPTHLPNGGFDGVVIVFKDITERKKIEEKLNYMAQYDALTGLGNRNLFGSALNNAITFSKHSGQLFALLFMDLDRFKQVNDTLGHNAGDQLLKDVALRVADCIRETDILCRLGGDEFTIIINGKAAEQASLRVSEKLISALSRPFEIFGQEIYVGASVGIVYYPGMGEDAHELIKNADMAMYQAKHEGRNRFRVFEHGMKAQIEESMALEIELRRATDNMDFFLHYQPKLDMSSGDIVGAEALIRWRVGDRLISPAVFIPVAEETGLIGSIGRWVFETACKQVRSWHDNYDLPPGFRVSVNMSVQQLQDEGLVHEITRILQQNHVQGEWMELEITESLLMEKTEANIERLSAIRQQGCGVALDDFGTGYSSMSYLAQLPLTVMKIDKTFVDGIHRPQGSAIVSAVLALARGLDVDVVAEGVETEDQARELEALGCRYAQGFHFAKPLAAADIEALLNQKYAKKLPGRRISP